jgi:hypothetical protein
MPDPDFFPSPILDPNLGSTGQKHRILDPDPQH